jgi:hypothetical protein
MNLLQNWIDEVNPVFAFLLMGGGFLIAGIAGWYLASGILWILQKDKK